MEGLGKEGGHCVVCRFPFMIKLDIDIRTEAALSIHPTYVYFVYSPFYS
jgi:hypothetical protein